MLPRPWPTAMDTAEAVVPECWEDGREERSSAAILAAFYYCLLFVTRTGLFLLIFFCFFGFFSLLITYKLYFLRPHINKNFKKIL
jgi:hypothetical protein